MKKSAEELLEEISDFLVIYLKSGHIHLNSFLSKTDLAISKMEQLLKIHFLLQEEVKDFVRVLPESIRNIKTSTKVIQETYYGEIRGQIHWNQTLYERLKSNYKDRLIFSVKERNREYAIKENLVLLELIRTLHSILFYELDSNHLEKYSWFKDWVYLKNVLNHLLQKNVYLSRVSQNAVSVTDRMIIDTMKHRSFLYKQAAKILQQYRKIMSGEMNKFEIQKLLRETFIQPQEEEVLFELYWVINLIKQNTHNAELHLIDGTNNLVAIWHDEKFTYKLYHDSVGSSAQFYITTDEINMYEHPFLKRQLQAMNEAAAFAEQWLNKSIDVTTYWSGRPDILIEVFERDTHKLVKLVIGEVKYTNRPEYIVTGLRELTDYMKLVKSFNGTFLEEEIEIQGILFSGKVDGQNERKQTLRINNLEKLTWCTY